MEISTVLELGREALLLTMLVCAPLLAVALLVGVGVGMLQAATSINETTLSFIPKVACMGLALLLFGAWQIGLLVDFGRALFARIPGLLG